MKKRDRKMDIFKGILVLGMITCHVFQFFVPLHLYPLAERFTWYINSVTFSGFVFAFGYTSALAYYSKGFKEVWLKMAMTSLRLLFAFYISGIAFRVFVNGHVINNKLILQIVLLQDIPGWSEFIVSFSGFTLIGLIAFNGFKWLKGHSKWIPYLAGLMLVLTFIPYGKVEWTVLGIFIGTEKFACFPVVQYMPFYLMGIYFCEKGVGYNGKIILTTLFLSGISLVYMMMHDWQLPGRFPPSLFWIIMPALPLYAYYLISKKLMKWQDKLQYPFSIGQYSMYYLLMSNLLIFATTGVKGLKALDPLTGLIATAFLLVVLKIILDFGSRSGKKINKQQELCYNTECVH